MSGEIFISYRSGDGAVAAALVDTALRQHFGDNRIFRDSRSIPTGEDFERYLLGSLRRSRVLLVIIGHEWLTAEGPSGRRLIGDPSDWVHREILEAIECDIPIIPLLLDDCTLPSVGQLPEPLAEIGKRQYVLLRSRYSDQDIATLIERILESAPELRLSPGSNAEGPQGLVDDRVNIGGSSVLNSIRVEREISGRLEINSGAQVIRGHFSRIGNQVKNIHKKPAWLAPIAAVVALLITLIMIKISSPEDGTSSEDQGGGIQPSLGLASATRSAITTPSTAATQIPAGETVGSLAEREAARANGKLLVTTLTGQTSVGYTIESLESGKTLGSFTLPARKSSTTGAVSSCDFTITTRADGKDVLLFFEADAKPSQGVLPGQIIQKVVARDLEGTTLWSAMSTPLPSSSTEGGASCGNYTNAATAQITPDRARLWINEFGSDWFVAINLMTGDMKPFPKAVGLAGSYAVVPAKPYMVGEKEDLVQLFDLGTGGVAGATTDPELSYSLRGGHYVTSRDGRRLVHDSFDSGMNRVYSLPGLTVVADGDYTEGPLSLAQATESVFILNSDVNQSRLWARSFESGKEVWSHSGKFDYCGLFDSSLYVISNGQLASLNTETGQQISFQSGFYTCPEILGGVMIIRDSSGVKIVKL